MAWVSGDWDNLGNFLSSGMKAFTSERQRNKDNEARDIQMAGQQAKDEAYIALLNEQMEASSGRRAADATAAERLRTPANKAWGGMAAGDVPLGELGAYQQYTSGQEELQDRQEGQNPVDAAIVEFFGEGGIPQGLSKDDFKDMLPYLMQMKVAGRRSELDGAGGSSGMNASVMGQIQKLEPRMRMDALYEFAQQDPELMQVLQGAQNRMTGEFEWNKVLEYLGPDGWQDLTDKTEYMVDEWLAGKGIVTPGMQGRYENRQAMLNEGDSTEEDPTGGGADSSGIVSDPELVDYMDRSHPSLGAPGPGAAQNIEELAESPFSKAWIGLDRYKTRGDWVKGIHSLQQESRSSGQRMPGFPSFGEETRQAQRDAALQKKLRVRKQGVGMNRLSRGSARGDMLQR